MSTLALSGWAQPADAVANAILPNASSFDYSDYPNVDAAFGALKKFAHAEHIIGWSLGGQLALRAISAGVLAPKRLTLIAVPFQFLKSPQIKPAMDRLTFDTFRDNYATDPVRTSGRFYALVAKGDSHAKMVMDKLRDHADIANTRRWLPWLDDLSSTTLMGMNLHAVPETLVVHGNEDAIVPVAQATLLAAVLPHAELDIWQGAAHAPHLHDPARLVASMAGQRSAA